MIQFKYKYLKINGDHGESVPARARRGQRGKYFFSFFHHGDIPQNFEFGLGSTGSVSRFLKLLFKLTSF